MRKYITIAMMILALILMCEKVNAATNWSVNQSRIVTDFNGTYTYSSWSNQSSAYTPTDPVVGLQYRLKVSGGAKADNSYVFRVAYKPTPDSITSTAPILVNNNGDPRDDFYCTDFTYNTSDGYYKSMCTWTPQTDMSTSDYLFVRIWYEGGGGYVTSLGIGLSAYDLRQGTGAIITDMGNEIIDTLDNNFSSIENKLDEDHQYNDNASENLNGQNELNQMQNQEDTLRNSMDFSAIEDNTITVDTNASNFIWGIVRRLRTMSSYIVLLTTTILGLGLIKMVLNR